MNKYRYTFKVVESTMKPGSYSLRDKNGNDPRNIVNKMIEDLGLVPGEEIVLEQVEHGLNL